MKDPGQSDQTAQFIILSKFLADNFGLHFPAEKYPDLKRGIEEITRTFRFENVSDCVNWITQKNLSQEDMDHIVSFFTVGETYFFREKKSFELLKNYILPRLIDERKNSNKILRVWSAACSSGEEAYSLAILLTEMIQDIQDWNISILASDINLNSLQKVKLGNYGNWSFRSAPEHLKQYFKKLGNMYEILPKFKKMVHPFYLNLVSDKYPSLLNNTNAMDVIFCRNVLMYFVSDKLNQVINSLERCLVPGGYLIVGASENHLIQHKSLDLVEIQGVYVFRKKTGHVRESIIDRIIQIPDTPKALEEPLEGVDTFDINDSLTEVHIEESVISETTTETFYSQAKQLANQGKLEEALKMIQLGIEEDKMNEILYYLKALILVELDKTDEAKGDLRRALYLNPDFILPYFALGNIAIAQGFQKEADKFYSIVLNLLKDRSDDEEILGSEGLSVQRLKEVIHSISSLKTNEKHLK